MRKTDNLEYIVYRMSVGQPLTFNVSQICRLPEDLDLDRVPTGSIGVQLYRGDDSDSEIKSYTVVPFETYATTLDIDGEFVALSGVCISSQNPRIRLEDNARVQNVSWGLGGLQYMNNYWADLIVNPGDYVGFLKTKDGRWYVWSSPQMYVDDGLKITVDLRTLCALSDLPSEKITAFVKVGMATEFPYNLRPDEKRRLPMKSDGANVSTRSVQVLMDLVAKGVVSGMTRTPDQEEIERARRLRGREDDSARQAAERAAIMDSALNAAEFAQNALRYAAEAQVRLKTEHNAEKFETLIASVSTMLDASTVERAKRDVRAWIDLGGEEADVTTAANTLDEAVAILQAMKLAGIKTLRTSVVKGESAEEIASLLGETLKAKLNYITGGIISEIGMPETAKDPLKSVFQDLVQNWIARVVISTAGGRAENDEEYKQAINAIFPMESDTRAPAPPFRIDAMPVWRLNQKKVVFSPAGLDEIIDGDGTGFTKTEKDIATFLRGLTTFNA